jgi:DNA-binding transcriptional LysR family regulator
MELRQLEYFVAVVDEGSFTSAAQRECVAQPAVSAQIQRLERHVGQPLLLRSRRGVALTQAGQAFLPHARAALAAVRAAQDAVDDVAGLVRGTLAIGTVTSHELDVAGLMADFHTDFPDVEIRLSTHDSASLIDMLGTGELDAAIVSIGVDEHPDGLDVAVVTDQALTAAVATDHPLASRATLSLEALCGHPLISLPRGTGLRRTLDDACVRAGITPRIFFEAGNPMALADLARRGLGVAVLPEGVATTRSDLHPLRITPELRGRLVWAWRTAPSPATRKFAERALRQLDSARRR